MHELGVVLNMLDTLDAAAKRYGVSRIASVSVDVGEMTGIVPVYMHGVWPEAVNGTICAGSELYINMVKAIAHCADCGRTTRSWKTPGTTSPCARFAAAPAGRSSRATSW